MPERGGGRHACDVSSAVPEGGTGGHVCDVPQRHRDLSDEMASTRDGMRGVLHAACHVYLTPALCPHIPRSHNALGLLLLTLSSSHQYCT